jgi:Ca2+-transporting ATPase
MALCNNASLAHGGSGDTTEIALLEYAQNEGVDLAALKESNPRLYEWSFDSERKRMSVAIQAGDKILVYAKGAPESLIPKCKLDTNQVDVITNKVSEFSQKGMRVLCFGWKTIDTSGVDLLLEEAESKLHFLGLTAMADPPRPESMLAIKKCQEAGIRVIMITGDHPQTAGAIAKELGIINENSSKVLTGLEMDGLSEAELIDLSKQVSVYARVSPANKLTLVNILKSQGHVVAMTGDGVNDAPALKTASIGVAMGKGGTEVARQASSMVLTDDNFATIVDAVEEGRAVNGNIKRTLQYLLSTNLAELMFILSATALGWAVPLLPINLLWLNLVSDGLPSLALAAERVPSHYLEEGNNPSAKSFFDRSFYQEMFIVGFIITVMSLSVYRYGLNHFDIPVARSLAFSFLVYVVLLRSFSSRSETKIFFEMKPNFYHLAAVGIPILFQMGMQKVDFMLDVFNIQALTLNQNIVLLILSLIPVSLVELFKLWRRK